MKEILNKTCTDCQSSNILFDEYKGELFCNHCGLILNNIYETIKITDYIGENNNEYIENLNIETKIFLK